MPQSLSSVLVHLIFSTKNREPFITLAIEQELHPYLASIFKELRSPSLTIGGTADHIHVLFSLGRMIKIAGLVEEVKTGSSKWIKTKGWKFRNFHWQKGYGAFSIGQSQVLTLKRYIARQRAHHQRITFKDEYRKFLKTYGIDYDERYVWDGSDSALSALYNCLSLIVPGPLAQAFTLRAVGAQGPWQNSF